MADLVDSYYADGGYLQFDKLTVNSLNRRPSEPGTNVFDVRVDEGGTTYATSRTASPQSYPGGAANYRVTLTQTDARWSVTDYVEIAR